MNTDTRQGLGSDGRLDEAGAGAVCGRRRGQSSSAKLASCRQDTGRIDEAWSQLGSPDMTAALLQQRQRSMLTDQRTEYPQTACTPDVNWTLQSPCTLCLQVNRLLSEDRSVISSCVSARLHCQPDVKRWHDVSILDSMLCQTCACETGCCCIPTSVCMQAVKMFKASIMHTVSKSSPNGCVMLVPGQSLGTVAKSACWSQQFYGL